MPTMCQRRPPYRNPERGLEEFRVSARNSLTCGFTFWAQISHSKWPSGQLPVTPVWACPCLGGQGHASLERTVPCRQDCVPIRNGAPGREGSVWEARQIDGPVPAHPAGPQGGDSPAWHHFWRGIQFAVSLHAAKLASGILRLCIPFRFWRGERSGTRVRNSFTWCCCVFS